MFDRKKFIDEIQHLGYSLVTNALDVEFIEKARAELVRVFDQEAEYHKNRQIDVNRGVVLLCSLYGKIFTDIFDNDKVMEPFNAVMGDGCIVYAYSSSSMPPHSSNSSTGIHVDCARIVPHYVTNMRAIVLLDDFTEENGATSFLPGSQHREEKPSEEFFRQNAIRLIAKAGSVFYFNARLWHSGGVNRTGRWRHALIFNVCRSWMKQRIDIPRAMSGMDLSKLSQKALQKLGFFAQVPASYDEYYAPPETRKFRQPTE